MQSDKTSTMSPESYIIKCYSVPPIVDHEPPIGVGGGSVAFDLPERNTLEDTVAPLALTGPHVYAFKSQKTPPTIYRYISDLLVITEEDTGYISVFRYRLPESEEAKLHLWYTGNGGTAAPDIIFEGTRADGKLTIKDSLNPPTPTSKPKRPNRRVCSISGLKIHKWALVRSSDDAIIKDPVTGKLLTDYDDDSYYFYISFHPHRLP